MPYYSLLQPTHLPLPYLLRYIRRPISLTDEELMPVPTGDQGDSAMYGGSQGGLEGIASYVADLGIPQPDYSSIWHAGSREYRGSRRMSVHRNMARNKVGCLIPDYIK
jgi:hypothetical protein